MIIPQRSDGAACGESLPQPRPIRYGRNAARGEGCLRRPDAPRNPAPLPDGAHRPPAAPRSAGETARSRPRTDSGPRRRLHPKRAAPAPPAAAPERNVATPATTARSRPADPGRVLSRDEIARSRSIARSTDTWRGSGASSREQPTSRGSSRACEAWATSLPGTSPRAERGRATIPAKEPRRAPCASTA